MVAAKEPTRPRRRYKYLPAELLEKLILNNRRLVNIQSSPSQQTLMDIQEVLDDLSKQRDSIPATIFNQRWERLTNIR